ncbi:MarR family winged helix-turn-helix transcriptional regulator [Symbiobacterium thermophilum]|uniref:MarR family winged helix-turn-helix transcriptional regulator n=1 Tax=Symbiobacterium thermophilum TaxID=2734 RepID=UPI0035C69900
MGVGVLSRTNVAAVERIAMVRRMASRLEQQCERYLRSAYGLSWPQFQVLRELSVERPTMLQRVNDAVYCTRGNLAAIIDRLERDGWLERFRLQGDRRVVMLSLTEKGAQVTAIEAELRARVREWLEPVWREAQEIQEYLGVLLRDMTDPLAAEEALKPKERLVAAS